MFVALALSGCSGPAERTWLDAPGWSRGRLVGNTQAVDAASMALDEAGNIYLLVFSGDEDIGYPRVVALNRQAAVVWDRTYEVALERPGRSRILWDGHALQLFWLSRQGIYQAQVEAATGELLGPPILLSGGVQVRYYDVAQDAGGATTVWYAGPQEAAGVYALFPDSLPGEATLVDPTGTRPEVQYDQAGTLHAVWIHYPPDKSPQFFYAAYQEGRYSLRSPGREALVLAPQVGNATLIGPRLGLDRERVYLLWTVLPILGASAGAAETSYVTFPLGQPAAAFLRSPTGQLRVPYGYHLSYQPLSGSGLQAGPRVPLASPLGDSTPYIIELAVNPAVAPELVVAFQTQLEYLMRKEQAQISAVFFQDGAPIAYQLLSFTPTVSRYPAILSDQAGQLYLTWLESGAPSGYSVYFASTAPDIRQALSGLTADDAGRLAAETIFGLLGGVVLAPWLLAWVMVPLVILGVTAPIRREDDSLTSPGVVVSLALALAAYWAGKLLLMPGLPSYVPFSAWLPMIPPGLNLPLQVGVPLLIAGLGLVVAWRYTYYGSERPSTLFFLLIYAALDGALTMAIYSPVFYASF